jgi:tricorn protease
MTRFPFAGRAPRAASRAALAALLSIVALFATTPVAAQSNALAATAPNDEPTRLLRQPTLSATQIAFMYGNDIWVVGRDGGDAKRLTSFPGQERAPHFSPDGRWIAFSAQYGGNTDVWVVPAQGGEPRRLTWHPGADVVQGWTPDGQRVVFSSGRTNAPSGAEVLDGRAGREHARGVLPMPRAHQGRSRRTAQRFAYRMVSSWEDEWRNYRGGQNRPIWILDLDDYDLEEEPTWDGSNDGYPVWIGETVYFLSDRDYANNIWAYDTNTKQTATGHALHRLRRQDAWTRTAALVFEQAGYIHTLDPATSGGAATRRHPRARRFPVADAAVGESAATHAQRRHLADRPARGVRGARRDLHGTGREGRLAQPDEHDWRRRAQRRHGRRTAAGSRTSATRRRVRAGHRAAGRRGERRTIELPEPSFYFTPAWSPDSRKILFTDTHLQLWVVDVASGQAPTHVDTDTYMAPERSMNPCGARTRAGSRTRSASTTSSTPSSCTTRGDGTCEQVTDGLSDATWPAWDAAASTCTSWPRPTSR